MPPARGRRGQRTSAVSALSTCSWTRKSLSVCKTNRTFRTAERCGNVCSTISIAGPRRRLDGITEHTGRDRRKRDRAAALLLSEQQRVSVAGGQQPIRRLVAAVDGAEAVNHVLVRQLVRAGNDRFARPDWCEGPAFFVESRSGRPVDRAGDAAARTQLRIGRVDDDVDIRLRGDIAPPALDRHSVRRRPIRHRAAS